jgi:hypothetical protein
MKVINIKTCGSCILLQTDENWDSYFKLDKNIHMPYGSVNLDKGVHINCPLRREDLQINLIKK